jgi:RNA polymerase sigma factor (sigma-70 family)
MDIEQLEGATHLEPRMAGRTEVERRAAFERFSQSRLDRAYRLAGVLLRDPDEAEDVVHDATVQAWLHWRQLRDPDRIDAWFDHILVNGCRARMRRRTIGVLDLSDPPETPGPNAFGVVDDRDVVHRALATLDTEHRIAVVLRYIADLSPAEIAARTGTHEGTVKSRLHYALSHMRAALEAAERKPGGSR